VKVFRIDLQRLLIRADRLFKSAELIQRESDIEVPARVVRVDVGGGAVLLERLLPLALLEELLSAFDASFGIVPVVGFHCSAARQKTLSDRIRSSMLLY
jgi:hypothetical protein